LRSINASPPIFAIPDQQIERDEAWIATVEQQIGELRFARTVQTHGFAIQDGAFIGQGFRDPLSGSVKDANVLPLREIN
jgi:hypothetical protein